MAGLTARFSLIDEMSDRMERIAQSGLAISDRFERAGEAASAAMDGISGDAAAAVSAVDGVAVSVTSLQGAANDASSSADTLTGVMQDYGSSAEEAASKTDYWTSAVGSYDKSVLEAIYTTDELVEMGYKSAAALEEQEEMLQLCERASTMLSKSMETATGVQTGLSAAMEAASKVTETLSDNENVSAETKEALAKASIDASEAMNGLRAAQEEAAEAMEAYDAVVKSGTTDLDELEAAAERAEHAAEALAEANGVASDATEELSKATEKTAKELEDCGKKGIDAIEGIASAFATLGITAMVKEITEATYELATAFSDAESIIVKATGASGAALDDLTNSMMRAYAASKSGSLENTASAIGEINTRMGLTGDELTEVTGQFLDFSEITGTNVVGSVQNVTKLMNKWGIEGRNVGNVLDRLAYAGQVSGISVDSLSSTVTNSSSTFQALGMDLDNTIGLLADLELYGTNSQTVVTGLRTAVNNFAADGLDAGEALRSVIEQIANMGDKSEATALAVETFGSRAGQELAGAIRSGAISVDSLSKSLEEADGTLNHTATAAQTLDQKWTQASNNIEAAFTSAVEPTLNSLSSRFADLANGFGDFLNEHPAVAKAIAALGVGLGVVVAGIAAAAVYCLAAIPAVKAFGATLNSALGPIGWAALAIGGLVTAVAAFAAMNYEAEDKTADMTAATRAQYYELQNLNDEYERACEEYGETSEEASRLKYQVDDLTASFEANRQTVEEVVAGVEELCEQSSKIRDDFNDALSDIDMNEVVTLALIQKYADLASQAELTGAQQIQLEAVTQQLSSMYPDLAAKLDSAALSADEYVAAMRHACEQEAKELRQQQAIETYIKEIANRDILQKQIEDLTERNRLINDTINDLTGSDFSRAAEESQEYLAKIETLNAELEATNAEIARIEQEWTDAAKAAVEAAEECISAEQAVAYAYEDVRERVEELCAAYEAAYQAALESFEGQFGLFDEAQADMEATVENAQKALDSQLAYWENYSSNLSVLKNTSAADLGITQENYDALMAYARSGSEEAAGLAASMADAINSGNADAVAALADTVGAVSAKQQEIAEMTAEWQTDFTEQMFELQMEMRETIVGMDMSDAAKRAALNTISSYAKQIKAGKAEAVSAAEEVADAVSLALTKSYASVGVSTGVSVSIPGHANGTTFAENAFVAGEDGPELIIRRVDACANGTVDSAAAFMAGEDGPELIVGAQGSTVFPTQETDRLIAALNERRRPLQVLAGGLRESNPDRETATEQVKRILLEVAGSGSIEVSGGEADKTTILEILTEHLKPVLMGILQSEIYEEGDLSYDF